MCGGGGGGGGLTHLAFWYRHVSEILYNHSIHKYSHPKIIYTVRHKLSIASLVSLKNEGSFPDMNIFVFYFGDNLQLIFIRLLLR